MSEHSLNDHSIGHIIRTTREAKGLCIERAQEETCIRKLFLEAIEADELETLPNGIYKRMYIKSYAKFLDIDDAPLLKKLDGISETTTTESPHTNEQQTATAEPKKWLIWGSAAACIILLTVFFIQSPPSIITAKQPAPTPLTSQVKLAIIEPTPEITLLATKALSVQLLNATGEITQTLTLAEGEVYFLPADNTPIIHTENMEDLEFYLNGNAVISINNLEEKHNGIVIDPIKMLANVHIDGLVSIVEHKANADDIKIAIDKAISSSTQKGYTLNNIAPAAGQEEQAESLETLVDSIELNEAH